MSTAILECCCCGAKLRERFNDPRAEEAILRLNDSTDRIWTEGIEDVEEFLWDRGMEPDEARRIALEASLPCPACGIPISPMCNCAFNVATPADVLGRVLTRDDWYWELVSVREVA